MRREAARTLREASGEQEDLRALMAAAAAIRARKDEILVANADIVRRKWRTWLPMIERLTLNDARIEVLAAGRREVVAARPIRWGASWHAGPASTAGHRPRFHAAHRRHRHHHLANRPQCDGRCALTLKSGIRRSCAAAAIPSARRRYSRRHDRGLKSSACPRPPSSM
ncbi:MAG: hypothetical protein H6924_03835 [Alphaproteobacteria bacterium]|nr:hypothetical protein [Alphaproteobacteria bacterium]